MKSKTTKKHKTKNKQTTVDYYDVVHLISLISPTLYDFFWSSRFFSLNTLKKKKERKIKGEKLIENLSVNKCNKTQITTLKNLVALFASPTHHSCRHENCSLLIQSAALEARINPLESLLSCRWRCQGFASKGQALHQKSTLP